ncbi:glycosyltransferase family 4 protein [Fundidesulfovibrio terrae]|uniref:glycosyltransferase family 4 protein n=1 Tax=Fundidesulfovibrio terrae TaxID=2922866 RepID=UPI001FAE9C8D|nr:glycosyltransferase family 4 protein [Fundidesulfovibrio terrae]
MKTMIAKRIWATLDPFVEQGPILGRTQANAGFLRGLLDLDPYDAYRFYPASAGACAQLSGALSERWPDLWGQGRIEVIERRQLPGQLRATPHHVFHLSDCIMHPGYLAAVRNACSGQIFPITSVTHSLSYARYGQDFLKHLSPCTTPRDAVVATSRAAVGVVREFYRFLREGYGLDPAVHREPAVEHVPLGVDLDEFQAQDEIRRARCRRSLGFGGEVVFLVLARLCHTSKMDFLPILRAFHRLSLGGFRLEGARLVLAGWTDESDWGRGVLEDLARNIGLPLTVAERPTDEQRRAFYAAADVFLSPSDNLQETFGLTLLEAQASGLPVIASDFDGYRDLVLPEESGLLVPTMGPSATEGVDLLAPMCFDNHTHLLLAQRMAVDVPAMAGAIRRLAESPGLRREMGRAGVRNASGYSWRAVAGRYADLWEKLWTREVPESPGTRHPSAVVYARVFAGFPAEVVGSAVTLTASRLGNAVYRGQDFPLVYEGLEAVVDEQAMRAVLVFARKPVAAAELTEKLMAAQPGMNAEKAQALVLWCLKHDLLERTHA